MREIVRYGHPMATKNQHNRPCKDMALVCNLARLGLHCIMWPG